MSKERTQTSKVYLVFYDYYGENTCKAVFSTREKAEEYVGEHLFFRIDEMYLDDINI